VSEGTGRRFRSPSSPVPACAKVCRNPSVLILRLGKKREKVTARTRLTQEPNRGTRLEKGGGKEALDLPPGGD